MKYVFMDNFRGFSETILPLQQITFLVGENSTGKSSFLKLLFMLSQPQFWFSPEYSIHEEVDLGNFRDIVSARSPDKSFFRVGVLSSGEEKKGNVLSCVFTMFTFENRDGTPVVSRYMQFTDRLLTKLTFKRKRIQYKTTRLSNAFADEEDIIRLFLGIVRDDSQDVEGYSLFPKGVSPDLPLPLAVAFLRGLDKGKSISGVGPAVTIPFSMDLTWIAPIRTKPQRTYDGTKKSFSPEGDHTPFVLRRTLRRKSRSTEFAGKLKTFGEASGLFDTIVPHSFGRNPQSPFEILVKFLGAQLNINNVGYGVSQVLPLIVEFLSRDENRTFAVQQPEVHLHPRAQAALGDLVAEVAAERDHSFIMETHSDYLIDRCRLNLAKRSETLGAQVIFFQHTDSGNKATVLRILEDGKYPPDQPPEFKDFFIKEEMNLLEV